MTVWFINDRERLPMSVSDEKFNEEYIASRYSEVVLPYG